MKSEALIKFMLGALLAAASANFGFLWKLSDKQAEHGERLARIEARLDVIKAGNQNQIAKLP